MEILKKQTVATVYLRPGDTLTVNYTDKEGVAHQLAQHTADEPLKVDTALIVKVQGEYGLRNGLGAILGEAQA